MLDLAYALPKQSIEALVPGASTEVIATTVKEWKVKKAAEVSAASLFIWDEMVDRKKAKKPFKIAHYANDRDHKEGIYSFVQKELGAAPVSAVYDVAMYRSGDDEPFVHVSLARCWPNDIHICDVEFSDRAKPVNDSDPTSDYRGWHGLHVFPEFLARLKEVAVSQGAKRISLVAAHPPLLAVFQKYGFEVSKTEMSQRALADGIGVPMILTL